CIEIAEGLHLDQRLPLRRTEEPRLLPPDAVEIALPASAGHGPEPPSELAADGRRTPFRDPLRTCQEAGRYDLDLESLALHATAFSRVVGSGEPTPDGSVDRRTPFIEEWL